eukprot:70047_1
MSDDNLEADNPFNQTKLEDSLKFESNFWKEEPTSTTNPSNPFNQGSAYDNVADTNYSKMNDNNNAYDDENHTNKHKTNAITSLFNNLKSKMKDDDDDNQQYNDDEDSAYETGKPKKKPPSSSQINNAPSMLNSTQIGLTHDELDKKEQYLDRREKQLVERKKRLEAVRHELNSTNIRRDNWPCSYYPITFHSIQQEIPPHARSHMKRMYTLVLMTFLCFVLNSLAELILYFTDVGSESDILLAVLYLFCGVCGAWRLWYRQIYYGIRDRRTLKMWVFFFLFYCSHRILYCHDFRDSIMGRSWYSYYDRCI